MKEGSLEAPTRHPLAWRDDDFYDADKLDAELRRVFDICHGCRRCFNLCDSFPRLFDLVDNSESGELDSVSSDGFKAVVDACTLCDMCFLTKCPYVPPHEFNLDFPHLMLRYRAVEQRAGKVGLIARKLNDTDGNGRLLGPLAPLVNWASDVGNRVTRPVMEKVAGIHRDAALPKYHGKTFVRRAKESLPAINREAPAFGRKAVLYATCFINYNDPVTGVLARKVLAHNGVETEVAYPACCGMPQLEQGDIAAVSERAKQVAAALGAWIDKGYDIVAMVPSCALMLKSEWPLILPEDEAVKRLAAHTRDISEYLADIGKTVGFAPGLKPLDGGVTVHLACHARAQNIGAKAADMLRLIPDTDVAVIERCSGHGGAWGVREENFETALKVGKPAARQAAGSGKAHLSSECPLAATHILQGLERIEGAAVPATAPHPVVLLARAYGFTA